MLFLITLFTLFFLAISFYVLDRDNKDLAMFIIKILIAMTLIKLGYFFYYNNKGEDYCATALRMMGCK